MPIPELTEKNQRVLRALLDQPHLERTATDIGGDVGLPPTTVAALLARLISYGWVVDRRSGTRRLYRLVLNRINEAQKAATAIRPNARTPDPSSTRLAVDNAGRETWTMSRLEAAVERGEESAAFLDLVKRRLKQLQD